MTIPNMTTKSYGDLYEVVEHIANSAKQAGADIRADARFTPDGKRAALQAQAQSAGWLRDLDAVDAELSRRVQAAADAKAAALTVRGAGDLAGEIRAMRYWQRTRPVLDRSDSPRAAVVDLIGSCDDADLPTVIQEAGPYFQAKGITDGDELIRQALFDRSPAAQAAHTDEQHAQTMRGVFRGLLGFARELSTDVDVTRPSGPGVVLKVAQVRTIDSERAA